LINANRPFEILELDLSGLLDAPGRLPTCA
jgi:hypothetical protein